MRTLINSILVILAAMVTIPTYAAELNPQSTITVINKSDRDLS